MRILLVATMAASVLAIGSSMEPAASRPLGGQADNPGAVHKVQQMSPGSGQGMERSKMRSEERGTRGDRPRMGPRSRGYIDGGREGRRGEWRGDRDIRRYGGRRGFEARPGYGYRAGCGWLRQRALETGSRYWWRRFRDCRH